MHACARVAGRGVRESERRHNNYVSERGRGVVGRAGWAKEARMGNKLEIIGVRLMKGLKQLDYKEALNCFEISVLKNELIIKLNKDIALKSNEHGLVRFEAINENNEVANNDTNEQQ